MARSRTARTGGDSHEDQAPTRARDLAAIALVQVGRIAALMADAENQLSWRTKGKYL